MRAAIFDLDGTLVDTAPDLVGALNDLLTAEGLPTVDAAEARRTAGMGSRALILHGWRAMGVEPDEALIALMQPRFLEAYEARIDHDSRFFGGAVDCVEALMRDGWRVGVCTNKPHGLAKLLFERLGASTLFHAMLGVGDGLPRKPDPRHFTETVARAGGAFGRAAMIGDTKTDRDAARNAGAPLALVTFGYALEPLDELAPDARFDDFAALPAILARLSPR